MDDDRWSELDNAVFPNLYKARTIFDRVQLLEDTIYSEASKIFGHRQYRRKSITTGMSRRTKECINLIKEKNKIKTKLSSTVNPLEHAALQDLLAPITDKIRSFRRAEKHRKKRRIFKKMQESFKRNPYQAGKNLLDPRSNVHLSIDKAKLDQYKANIAKDEHYHDILESLEGLPPNPSIKIPFTSSSFSDEQFFRIIQSRRNKSAPGLNQIPYIVYKKCTQIRSFLFDIFSSCLKHSVVPLQWRYAKEHYIPKSKPPNPSDVKDFRPIALLNVEGKLFFSLLSKRLETHIIENNKFINTTVQKGCMERVPGCWEHMSMVWSSLKEAREQKSTVANIWLDIANAYGSIPHRLIFFALQRYGIGPKWMNVIRNYYCGLYTKSFSESAPSNWHHHFKGIFAGCTISIILFLAGMNVIVEYVMTSKATQFVHSTNVKLPLVRAFMDDLNLMSSSISGAQDLLYKCTEALKWAGMNFRADKSRSIIIFKGKSLNSTPFRIVDPLSPTDFNCYIPSIHASPVKFLGRLIDGSLTDRKAIDELEEKLSTCLEILNKSSFLGAQKLWFLQHLVIPRIQWSLLIYEVSISCATSLETKISVNIRKWLKLHPSISKLSLYSPLSPCPLPLKSLTTILKSSKISGHLLLRDSHDSTISSSNPKLKVGNWNVCKATTIAEAEMTFRQIQGPRQIGRCGVGIAKLDPIPDKNTHDYRKMVSSTLRSIDEEKDSQKALQLKLQCCWMQWENYVKNNLTWKNILALPPNLLSFCIGSTYNVLPSPSNLHRWQLTKDSSCFLCGKSICTIAHILGACNTSLKQGRFTYRHDSILKYLVSTLKTFIKSSPTTKPKKINKINFLKEGRKPPSKSNSTQGILHLSSDWVLLADLDENYVFPIDIALTQLRPDVVLFSKNIRRVILIELTCPCEENMDSWHATKINKYSSLLKVISNNNWKVDLFAVEIGARGYAANSMRVCLNRLGLPRNLIKNSVQSLCRVSMECSFYIWLCRNTKEWTTPNYTMKPIQLRDKKVEKEKFCGSKVRKNVSSVQSQIQVTNLKHAGFNNKGNTCYANAILQALSTIPSFWCQQSSEAGSISPLERSVSLNLSLLKRRSAPIDPSNFLNALQNLISLKRGIPFNVNTQQDAPEILQIILDELKGVSTIADDIISSSFTTTTTCNECFSYNEEETKQDIIQLPLTKSISSSIEKFLSSEHLSGNNKWFCTLCNRYQESERSINFVKCGNILIFHLLRYINFDGNLIKDNKRVNVFSEDLIIPVKTDDVVTVNRKFKLKATINHSGTLAAGHYWAFIKESTNMIWIKCNDTSVTKANFKDLSNGSSYILIYSSD